MSFAELEPRPGTPRQSVQTPEFIGDRLLRAALPGSREPDGKTLFNDTLYYSMKH